VTNDVPRSCPAGPVADTLMSARYEDLRREVLDGLNSQVIGRAVLMHKGMVGWMDACARVAPQHPADGSRPEQSLLPTGLRGEVVMLLAEMALGIGRREVLT